MSFTSYSLENDKRFKAAIERASAACDDLRVPFGLILKDFYRSEQAIFQLGTRGQYPEISPKYAKRKQTKYGFVYPLLKASGGLSKSVLQPNAEGSIAEIRMKELMFGTSIPYAKYHQSDEPRKKIPLRKFLFIGPEAPEFATSDQVGRATRWLNIMNDHVLKEIKRQGAFT